MVTDATRVEAYRRALRSVITPDSFVIEIGTGIGVFAVIAKQLGARRVVAIEPSDAIAVAKMIAHDNGATGIEFIHGLSTDVSLSEKADVIVSDLRGVLPLFDSHLASVIDARERLLAPQGTLIPAADTLYAAVVEFPKQYNVRTPAHSADGTVKLDALRRFTTNSWQKARFQPEHLLTQPAAWATIDYRAINGADVAGTATFGIERNGCAHGLALWFDATLVEGVTFSNAPNHPHLVYGSAFFPWPEAVDVQQGDQIHVHIEARHVGDEYLWRWDSELRPADSASARIKRFRQSTLDATPLVLRNLAKADAARATVLNNDGAVERYILQAMDGSTTNREIANQLLEHFPRVFSTFNDALGRVGSVARRFGAP